MTSVIVSQVGNAWTWSPSTTPTVSTPPRVRKVASLMSSPSDRRRDKDAAVRVVEGLPGHELVHRVGGAPLVRDLRFGEVVEVGMPGVLVELLELGRVLDRVAVGVQEVA